MNLIDDPALTFHRTALMPVHQARQAAGKAGFPMGPDTSQDSYFTAVPEMPVLASFTDAGVESVDGLVNAVASHWKARGAEDLAAVSTQLANCARDINQAGDPANPDGDVSDFTYVLF